MFIRSGEETPTILYDNHHPKGHHRHIGKHEEPYKSLTARRLVPDFLAQGARIGRRREMKTVTFSIRPRR
jgi:hypothetical protein